MKMTRQHAVLQGNFFSFFFLLTECWKLQWTQQDGICTYLLNSASFMYVYTYIYIYIYIVIEPLLTVMTVMMLTINKLLYTLK